MNEPQVWVLIGVFATVMLGGMTLMTTLINRATAHAIGGVRGEMNGFHGEMNGLRGEMDGLREGMNGLRSEMNARFERVDARFDTVNAKIEHLDRDVSMLIHRALGEPTTE